MLSRILATKGHPCPEGMVTAMGHLSDGNHRGRTWPVRALAALLLVSFGVGAGATAASAHGAEGNISAADLVRTAIAVLEVHPAPSAAVDDKIHDALDAKDQRDVDVALVTQAGEALDAGEVASAKALLERSIGECPDNDVLFVSDQSPTPPCVAPRHALAVARRSIGGTGEVVVLIIAALLVLAGVAVIRHPYVRHGETSTT